MTADPQVEAQEQAAGTEPIPAQETAPTVELWGVPREGAVLPPRGHYHR